MPPPMCAHNLLLKASFLPPRDHPSLLSDWLTLHFKFFIYYWFSLISITQLISNYKSLSHVFIVILLLMNLKMTNKQINRWQISNVDVLSRSSLPSIWFILISCVLIFMNYLSELTYWPFIRFSLQYQEIDHIFFSGILFV